MTQPNPGTVPGAPADPSTPPAPGAPAPAPTGTPTPQPGLDPSAPIDFTALAATHPNVAAYIASLRQENGSHRQGKTAAEQAAAEAKSQRDAVLKALGINADGSPAKDPAVAAAELTQRATDAENAAWGAALKLQVYQLAGKLGADPHALLDSNSFVNSLDDIADDNPDSATFATALEAKIAEAVGRNANLRATPAAPGRSGGDFPGGPGANQAITEEQLAQMKPHEIEAAYKDGKLKHLM